MRGLYAVVVAVALLLSATSTVRADAVASPGKFTAAISVSLPDLNTGTPVSVQLLKGKRKRLLVINGVVALAPPGPLVTCAAYVSVNGVSAEPSNGGYPLADLTSYLSAQWWFDLDAAEQANPGQFINTPLNVAVIPQCGSQPGSVSITALMVKK